MKKWRLVGKVAVLACSVLLFGGYVFVRAGGKLWPTASDDAPPREESVFFSGSKSMQLGPALSVQPPTEDAQRGVIMGGSKNGIVFEPEDASPKANTTGNSPQSSPPQPAPPAPNQAQGRRSQP